MQDGFTGEAVLEVRVELVGDLLGEMLILA